LPSKEVSENIYSLASDIMHCEIKLAIPLGSQESHIDDRT